MKCDRNAFEREALQKVYEGVRAKVHDFLCDVEFVCVYVPCRMLVVLTI